MKARFAFALLALSLSLGAQVTLSVASFSTQQQGQPNGLGWGFISSPNVTSQNYTGVSITASNGTGIAPSTPYAWTITDNGNVVQTCATSKCTTPGYSYVAPNTHDGKIDASGDASGDNATVVYYAPIDFPGNLTLQVCATDHATPTPSTTCATATIPPGAFPAELMKRRGRMLGMNNQPWSIWESGNPTTYQSSMSYFPNPFLPGTYMGIQILTNTTVNSPVTAGSAISRPLWSFDGRRMIVNSDACQPSLNCQNTTFDYLQNSDGSAFQNIHDTYGAVDTFVWDVNRPNWLLMENDNSFPPTGHVDIWDTSSPATAAVTAFTYTSSTPGCAGALCIAQFFTYMGGPGNTRNVLKEFNYHDSGNNPTCSPVATCVGGGNGPLMRTLDFSACEASGTPTPGCANLLATWNLNLGLGSWTSGTAATCDGTAPFNSTSSYYDSAGNPHQINACEAGAHDFTYRRGTDQIIFNYGTRGGAAEPIFFSVNDDGTGLQLFYADQRAVNNRPFMGHPTWGANGIVVYGGQQYCNAASTSSACGSASSGIGWWNPSLDGHCSLNPTFPACGLVQFTTGPAYGHSAWDGYDLNVIGHDDAGETVVGGFQHQVLWESLWSPAQETEQEVFDFGNRPEQVGTGNTNFPIVNGPTQSPDGTKLGYSVPITISQDTVASPNNVQVSTNFIFQVATPQAPPQLTLGSTSAAKINWLPPALSHEAEKFWLYKQPSCSGAWTQLASVNAVYAQTSAYSYTDSALTSGSACYGVSTEEWSGQESALLSPVIGITDTAGAFSVTSRSPAGLADFHTAAPGAVIGLTAAKTLVCATNCAAANTPTAPTLSETDTGGSLASGTYEVEVTHVKWTDSPANTVATETLPSAAASIVIGAGNTGTLTMQTVSSEMVGQDAERFYVKAPGESSFTLRATITIPDYANGNGGSGANQVSQTFTTLPAPGADAPVTNTAVGGYTLSWTLPADTDLQRVMVFSREGSAPPNANPWTYEISAQPAAATSFYDAFPNLEPVGDLYYMVKTLDMDGNLSAGMCYDATAVTSVSCT